jgi:hypothetical protein
VQRAADITGLLFLIEILGLRKRIIACSECEYIAIGLDLISPCIEAG